MTLANLISGERGRDFAILLGIGVFMAAIGAFDTNGAAIGRRLIYWLGLTMIAGITHNVLNARFASATFATGIWRKSIMLAMVMTILLTPVVWLFSSVVFGATLSLTRLIALAPGVLILNGALVALLGVTQQRHTNANEPALAAETIPDSIREMLPVSLRKATLHAVQAEDHYIHAHTSDGSAMIRMTMRDAITALDSNIGFQTHRSWWVREASIRNVSWKRGSATLQIDCDMTVPVSRAFAKKLVEEKRL